MSDAPLKIHHLWNATTLHSDYASTNGVLTFVSQETDTPGVFAYGISVCMPGDQFVKARGIFNATQRLNEQISKVENGLSSFFVYRGVKRYVDIKFMMLISALADLRSDGKRKKSLPKWAEQTIRNELAYVYGSSFVGYGS